MRVHKREGRPSLGPRTHVKIWVAVTLGTPALKGVETEAFPGLAGCQPGSGVSEKPCVKGMRQRVIE